jgi:hypothetical protein
MGVEAKCRLHRILSFESEAVLLPVRCSIRSLCTYNVHYYNVYTWTYTNKCRCGLVVLYHARQLFNQEDEEKTTRLYYVGVIQRSTLYITVCKWYVMYICCMVLYPAIHHPAPLHHMYQIKNLYIESHKIVNCNRSHKRRI